MLKKQVWFSALNLSVYDKWKVSWWYTL